MKKACWSTVLALAVSIIATAVLEAYAGDVDTTIVDPCELNSNACKDDDE